MSVRVLWSQCPCVHRRNLSIIIIVDGDRDLRHRRNNNNDDNNNNLNGIEALPRRTVTCRM